MNSDCDLGYYSSKQSLGVPCIPRKGALARAGPGYWKNTIESLLRCGCASLAVLVQSLALAAHIGWIPPIEGGWEFRV